MVEFHLDGSQLNDAGLVHVAELKNVVALNLKGTKITDAGLKHLRESKSLRSLHLEKTQISDAGIAHLSELTELEYLNLYETKITDKALGHLSKMKKLRRLFVWKTKVTTGQADKLQESLPSVQVIHGVDLSKLPKISLPPKKQPPKPKTSLKWIATANEKDAPKSKTGKNVQLFFENKSKLKIHIYWVSYEGELKIYGKLDPGGKKQQNTFAKNTWLITDSKDKPLGYFIVGEASAFAIIHKLD